MSGKYWIKLYKEIIDDPKMGLLTDRLYRRTIEIFLLSDDDGYLPDIEHITWKLRRTTEELETDFADLASTGILQKKKDRWFITNYAKRQAPVSGAERVREHRKRKQKSLYYGNESETKRYRELELELDTELETEEKHSSSNNLPPFDDIFGEWKVLFPDKPQPKPTTKSYRDKIKTRWKSQEFQDSWRDALVKASESPTLQNQSWFDFRFFIRNDENYQKCLDGWMDWKDQQLDGQPDQNIPEGV